MAIDKVREYLKKYNKENDILEFNVSSATVDLAAEAIGCEPDRIAKSLGFCIEDRVILVVASGKARIDNAKYRAEFNAKAHMIPFDDVEKLVGYAAGGVCPFGVNEEVEIYLDNSLKKYEYVYPAAGSDNSAVKISINDLEICTNFIKWIDVCKEI